MKELLKQFRDPKPEFSPIPFWFWNDTLTEAEILRQIEDFNAKGVNGFVIHPRMGMPEELVYLSDEFMHYVKFAVECAAERGMRVILYDEAAYPSGSAHGQVVASAPTLASKGLCMVEGDASDDENVVAQLWVKMVDGRVADVSKTPLDGYDKYSFVLRYSHGTIRGIHYGEDDGQPNAPASSDILCRRATDRFIELTHERYYEWLKPYFGNTVIAFFIDEPGIMGRCHDRGLIEWTDDFLEFYLDFGGEVTDLPHLFTGDRPEITALYRKAVSDMLRANFYEVISNWCESHDIVLTGHPGGSDDIGLLAHFGMPCQDIVWRYIEPSNDTGIVGIHSTMGKCASDSARHRGRRRCGNEVLGCCGPKNDLWAFTFEDMMWYFNWLFVRGNNLMIPHAFFYSIREKRRDERPPDVGPNSPWWSDYNRVSDYIKRMCELNTDSVNCAQVAILCREDKLSWQIAKPLFENQIEFNYLEVELLDGAAIGKTVDVAKQMYGTLIVDENVRLTDAEKAILDGFGGNVIYYNCDGVGLKNEVTVNSDEALLDAVRASTTPDFVTDGSIPSLRVSHITKCGEDVYILFNEGDDAIEIDLPFGGEIWSPWDGSAASADKRLKLDGRQLVVFARE